MYDPRIGRFLSEDPTGMADGPNVYTYAHNDPVNGVDPAGLSTKLLTGAGYALGSAIGSAWNAGSSLLNSAGSYFGGSTGRSSSGYTLLPGVAEVYKAQVAATNAAIDASYAQLDQLQREIDQENLNLALNAAARAGRAMREQNRRPDVYEAAFRNSSQLTFKTLVEPNPLYQSAAFGWNEGQRAAAVWNNTHYMGTGQRLYVTGGVVAGDAIGLTNLSDAGSRHDAVDGHVQTTGERILKGGSGSTQLLSAAVPIAAAGRLGSFTTRLQIKGIQSELRSRGWKVINGGQLGEEYIAGPMGRLGSAYPDITAVKNGRYLRINTIDTMADGVTPTTREATNAAKIRALRPTDHLLLVPKR